MRMSHVFANSRGIVVFCVGLNRTSSSLPRGTHSCRLPSHCPPPGPILLSTIPRFLLPCIALNRWLYPHSPASAEDDYICASFHYPWHIPLINRLLTPANEITHQVISYQVISSTQCSCYLQCLGYMWVIILRFLADVYPSSIWGRYLHCSHGWHRMQRRAKSIAIIL